MSAIRNAAFASGTGIKGGSTGADNTFYHLTDHLGSVYYLTDEKGSIVTENDYDEFGIVLKNKPKTTIPPYNPTGYTGEPQHNEADGLVYLRNRFYEPASGRFIQCDPISLLKKYVYVRNSPLNFVDPSGLKEQSFDGQDPGFNASDITELDTFDPKIYDAFEKIMRETEPMPGANHPECSTFARRIAEEVRYLERISGANVTVYIRSDPNYNIITGGHHWTYVKFKKRGIIEWWRVESNVPFGPHFKATPFIISTPKVTVPQPNPDKPETKRICDLN